jgi:Cu(I)/Ag(I) efflux system membrane protein CusA/SilA
MDSKLRFPGLTNTWTMQIENRLDMELVGIRTPVGLKIPGPNLGVLPEMRAGFA